MPHKTLELCIYDNFRRRDFDVNDLICMLGLSQSYVHELTYKYYGQSPGELIESFRLDAAIRRLHSDENFIMLSISCGFGSVKTFSRVFQKRISISAMAARKQLMESTDRELQIKTWQQIIWERGNGLFLIPSIIKDRYKRPL